MASQAVVATSFRGQLLPGALRSNLLQSTHLEELGEAESLVEEQRPPSANAEQK